MRLELVNNFCRFAELREDWNRLAGDLPMRQFEWAYTWAETMLGKGKLMLMVGHVQDRVVGIAPFYRQYNWRTGDAIQFLGDGECCTDYCTLLVETRYAKQFADETADWLSAHSVGYAINDIESITSDSEQWLGWDSIDLQGVSHDDFAVRRFADQMAANDCSVAIQNDQSAWHLPLDQSWDDLVAGLSKSQRRNVRLVQRRVLEADGFEIHQATDRESLAFGMHWFRKLHQRRWEAIGEPGCFANEGFAEFLELIAQRMFDLGKLRLLWIEKEGVPIAVDFTFLSNNASHGYQIGIDPDFRRLEIGRALMAAAIQATSASGRTTFDFLRGDEAYKSHWGAKACPLLHVRIVASRSLPKLRQNLIDFGRDLKHRLIGQS